MKAWQAAEAKQNFSRLVDAARIEPQALMRHAEAVGVVMSMDHYLTLKKQAGAEFAKFLMASPLEESDFDKSVGMSLSGGG